MEFIKKKNHMSLLSQFVEIQKDVLFVKGSDKNVVVTRVYKNVDTVEG